MEKNNAPGFAFTKDTSAATLAPAKAEVNGKQNHRVQKRGTQQAMQHHQGHGRLDLVSEYPRAWCQALLSEFAALQRSLGITTIYVTHNRTEIAALGCETARMREGRIDLGAAPDKALSPAPEAGASQGVTGRQRVNHRAFAENPIKLLENSVVTQHNNE